MIDRKLLTDMAQEKISSLQIQIAPMQAELDKWLAFLSNVQNEDVLILDSSGASTDLPVQRAPVPKPDAPNDGRIGWADPIRNYFETHDKKFIPASQVAAAVLKEVKIERKAFNKMKPKIYSQLATFEKQKKCKSEKRGKKVYYKWTA